MTELVRDAEWQRLDPRMLLVHPVRDVIRFLPALIGLFVAGTAAGGGPWQYLGVLIPVSMGLVRYLTTRYRFSQGRVELRRGLLNRHVLSTPLDRVRTVDVTASLIHRVLGLATVRIGTGTASTDSDERLDLDGLPAERARGLRAESLHAAPSTTHDDVAEAPAQPEERLALSLDPGWARYAPLTSSGAVITVGLFGGGAQLLSELGAFSGVDARDWSLSIPVWAAVVVGAVGLLVGVAVLSVAGYLVTNWDFRLSHTPGSWHLSRGLLTTRETSIDDGRLAGVSIGEPIGLRLAGAARLAIVTGLGARRQARRSRRRPLQRAEVVRVSGQVLGTDGPATNGFTDHGPAAVRRRYTRALGPALTALAAAVVRDPRRRLVMVAARGPGRCGPDRADPRVGPGAVTRARARGRVRRRPVRQPEPPTRGAGDRARHRLDVPEHLVPAPGRPDHPGRDHGRRSPGGHPARRAGAGRRRTGRYCGPSTGIRLRLSSGRQRRLAKSWAVVSRHD